MAPAAAGLLSVFAEELEELDEESLEDEPDEDAAVDDDEPDDRLSVR